MNRSLRRAVRVIAALVVLALLAAGAAWLLRGPEQKSLTAFFPRATGLYEASSVRVLGVTIGTITKVEPQGDRVRVVMSYDAKYKLPADAAAVLVPPSIVSDRYVQIAPVYTEGPVLADDATIPMERTQVPLELDEIFADIDTLVKALGPDGANKSGAFADLVKTGAANLDGNGAALNGALREFSKAISTLADSRGELFGTVSALQQFTTALAQDDAGVRRVNQDLAEVSVQLANERQELGLALKNLATGLGQVASFVRENKTALTDDIKALTQTTNTVLKEKRALIEFLDLAPAALENLALSFDPETRTLRVRSNAENSSDPSDPTNPICQLFTLLGQPCPGVSGPVTAPTGGLPLDAPSAARAAADPNAIAGTSGVDALDALMRLGLTR